MPNDRWLEIERLYNEALEQPPEMRTAFLVRAATDPTVRREVESLLAHRQEGDLLLENDPWKSGAPEPPFPLNQLGVYKVESMLGRGGMGIVYRAFDTRLNRPAAIKILSVDLTGPNALRRFQREAQMASALNHPHILTVYDAGEIDGRQYLVTELVDGGTLTDWAKSAPRSWRECVELLTGVADGLACAHEAGILHRDIKPDNILVAKNGYAKLADFGLAKMLESDSAGENGDQHSQITHPGMVIGTVAYLSPEQAAGKPVDARGDIFCFGLVLYEMVCGRRAFRGVSNLEILQKIMYSRPEPAPDTLPAELRMILGKALEKQPADRYQTTRDLVVDLRRLLRQQDQTAAAASTSAPSPPAQRPLWQYIAAAVAIATVSMGGLALFLNTRRPPGPGQPEFTQITNFTDSAHAPSLSADGRMVTFIRGGEHFQSRGQVYVKVLPDGEAARLSNDPDLKYGPAFSPDGSRVAYTVLKPGASWDTWTVPVLGGEATRLLPNASGLIWIAPRQLLFSEIEPGTGVHMGIVTSAEDRTGERSIYFPPHKRAMAHYSYASPDRKWVLIVEMDAATAWLPCRLISMNGTDTRQVGPKGACLAAGWSPDGKWMYFNAEVDGGWHLWRQRFPDGLPEQLTFGPSEEQGLAVAPDGQSLVTSVGRRYNTIWMHDGETGDRQVLAEGFAFFPSLSADYTRIYYMKRGSPAAISSQRSGDEPSSPFGITGSLWSLELSTGKTEPILPDVSAHGYQISRDGKDVLFSTSDNGQRRLWIAPLDRHVPPRLVMTGESATVIGRPGEIVFRATDGDRDYYYRMNLDGSGRQRISDTPVLAIPRISYDGDWVSGITAAPGAQSRWETTIFEVHGKRAIKFSAFFAILSWARDGKWLYIDPDTSRNAAGAKTYAIPLKPGKPLPDLPEGGFQTVKDLLKVPGMQIVARGTISVGPDPATYLFEKKGFEGNLFRIRWPRLTQ